MIIIFLQYLFFAVNSVITGARLRKEEGVVYIQIQQGKLLENGRINETTVTWKDQLYGNYRTNERQSYIANIMVFHLFTDSLIDPANHFKLHWRARSIELGDIDVSPGHVLVGLKFENETVDGVERLSLVALSKLFNYTTGKIISKEKEFFSSRAPSS